jgi:hypothetical protein
LNKPAAAAAASTAAIAAVAATAATAATTAATTAAAAVELLFKYQISNQQHHVLCVHAHHVVP